MNIKEVFHAANISQVELALDSGITEATISRWLSGRKMTNDENLAKIQAAVMRIAQKRKSQLNELLT